MIIRSSFTCSRTTVLTSGFPLHLTNKPINTMAPGNRSTIFKSMQTWKYTQCYSFMLESSYLTENFHRYMVEHIYLPVDIMEYLFSSRCQDKLCSSTRQHINSSTAASYNHLKSSSGRGKSIGTEHRDWEQAG